MNPSLKTLCDHLGYQFKDSTLLEQALTHRSYDKNNNERLEFLGDALLNVCVAELLFDLQPPYQEGALTRLRANLVNGEMLATLAKELQIDEYIRMGAGEKKTGGAQRKSTLENTIEAIIAAIYLDSDITVCRQKINDWFSKKLEEAISEGVKKDPKTQLQEHTQANKLTLPTYQTIKVQGKDHQQEFRVTCSISELSHVGIGVGSSRRRAEQEAAQTVLHWLEKNESNT